jgi:hypothetical protein
MRTKLQLIDKFRRPQWLAGRDHYYFVLRVVDGRGTESRIYERRVSRQCYYRFAVGEFAFSQNPAATKQMAQSEDEL